MAQKRLIDKKISVSEDVASLSIEAQLFTWMIPHADDAGLLPYSPRAIKALVVPMLDIRVEDIGIHLESIRKAGLIHTLKWEGDKFWRITSFFSHQTLKRDRKPQIIAKNMGSWEVIDRSGIHSLPNGNQMEPEGRKEGREGSKDNFSLTEKYKQVMSSKSKIGKPV